VTPIERARPPEPRMPVAPELALRVAIIGGVAMVMFGVIFFRLWYLQVLTGERYVAQANANSVRNLPIAAPRGEIFDREGTPIVASRTTNAVQIVPTALPPAGARRDALYRRLGGLLGMSPAHIAALVVRGRTAVPYAPVTIKTDAGLGVLTVLGERANEYPGVVQQPVSIRSYPYGETAAQVIGHVDQVSEQELKMNAFRGVIPGTIVGQEGLEYYYDRYLRGEAGVQRVAVDAAGYPVATRLPSKAPVAGHSLKLTLDLGLQQEAEGALREGIEHARASGKPANAGAFTAIDPRNGQVLAIGSYPSFDPNKFAKPLTPGEYAALVGNGPEGGRLTDRAVNGAYPTGSTFKPITAMAALEGGVITPEEGLGAGQCIYVSTEPFCNAGHAEYGAVGLVQALKVSSDTYFFETGELANSHGTVIQDGEARLALGAGRVAGVRVGGELIEGDAVIAATGAWTRSFLQAAGLEVPVGAQRGQIMHIRLDAAGTSRWPVVLPGASGHYLLAFDGGRIVAGATRETGSGLDYRVTPAGLAEILSQALAVAPGLADATYLETRVGFRPVGPGIRPLLGPVAGLDGLVVATGLGASGLTIGPLAGSLAAQAALGLPRATDLEPFAPLPEPPGSR